MSSSYDWSLPPLDSADQRLADAYRSVGRRLDDLAYSADFEEIIRQLNLPATNEVRQATYRRLLALKTSGRLPRMY